MKTVTSKEELKDALKNKENEIHVVGEYAKTIQKRLANKKKIKWAGVGIIAASLVAIPFVGGAAAIPVMGLTAGAEGVALTGVELAMVLGAGTFLGALFIFKGYTIEIGDGKVVFKKK
ncbi:MAG: hypothetical protein IKH97_09210 [Bacteroidales bacterium]|nr:hypothetical protein [Bacteroidales bacterium]